jgi:hypothetical protein
MVLELFAGSVPEAGAEASRPAKNVCCKYFFNILDYFVKN